MTIKGFVDKSYTAYSKVMKSAKEEIHSVKVNRSEQESFDKRHGKTCGKIKDCYNKVNGSKSIFTYGNAPKRLDMALEYSWLLGALPNDMK